MPSVYNNDEPTTTFVCMAYTGGLDEHSNKDDFQSYLGDLDEISNKKDVHSWGSK